MAEWRAGRTVRAGVTSVCLLVAPVLAAGQSVSLLHDGIQLKLFANLSILGIASTDRPFAPGDPIFLLPESPFGFHTNTFDLHARQSNFGFVFTGPKIKGLTTGALFVAYIQNEDITVDGYGFLPFLAFGELRNEKWRFAGGLTLDVFSPLFPHVIPFSVFYGTGNVGTYRGQVRLERYFEPSKKAHFTIQFGVGDPVASVVTNNRDILEDNGWPNVELRLAAGLGSIKQRLGARKSRSFDLGVSGVAGQLRTTGIIRAPAQFDSPDRQVVDVQGLAVDVQMSFGKRFGFTGELYAGDGLGEYAGGVFQSFNPFNADAIASKGAWGEAFVYFSNKVHLHGGYGIDDPDNDDIARTQIMRNQTAFGTLYWDISRIFQLGFETDWRNTNYFAPLLDADGWLFMSQVLWRF